jgi:16S rRNA (guanine527-N7)-methyltransferase
VNPELVALLGEDLAALGLSLDGAVQQRLLDFLDRVLKANETMNLTAITDPKEAVRKHLIDSLSVLLLKDLALQAQAPCSWVDVGSGAGFPGLALACAVPQATLHLVESTGKKAHFLNITAAELGLIRRVQVHGDRAEVLAALPKAGAPGNLRETSDAVFFRGVARLASLVELGAPFLKVGGLLIAYKGPKAGEELLEAGRAMAELKCTLVERKDFVLPGIQEARSLICLKKTAATTKRYPRLTGLAQKEPLLEPNTKQ